ncbi:hypothetical protein C5E07_17915 [Pseudoclavibacter sp. RFBJ3]|uniref:hypothetical protein n=1 Tax=unclassified Pseudoclavibacter TaxID=2615177 RepID=UPI000CE8E915|nr:MULTISPECIES: hypothetical protein [unclassified Pseudoclavibacter]PPF87234.1 hypothetical protein C5C12_00975 [Pseudoclavibacter sp. RFBJ5]PPF89457.1 hypothetical protein C5E07_17915 [Pseudoclavibacter sp. RFBJ3]PPG00738.1 hypothetical protein C5C19_00825 [Pseudoclavibacter sp. RFBH5]PPG18846.1 hypothetical protein C5E13_17630 [Pseudoclavibacter sp. RFBI4]
MPRPTLLFGNSLHVLESFATSDGVIDCRIERPASLTTSARAFVLAVDLRGSSTSLHARRQLKAVLKDAVVEARRYGQFAHFIVVYAAGKLDDARLDSVAAGLAVSVHASLERELGESADVVLLDVTACTAPEQLTRRLAAHIQRPAGAASDTALKWRDVEHNSIAAAATSDYC